MNEYILIIRGGDQVAATKSAEVIQKHMEKWHAWMKGIADEGKLLGGQPLAAEGKSIIESGTKVIDRPLAEGKEMIGGYILMKSETLVTATNVAKGCPVYEYGGTVEIREIRPL